MIRLFPSRRVEKETGIDFELLSNICTDIFEKGFGRKINIYCRVWKSRVKNNQLWNDLHEVYVTIKWT